MKGIIVEFLSGLIVLTLSVLIVYSIAKAASQKVFEEKKDTILWALKEIGVDLPKRPVIYYYSATGWMLEKAYDGDSGMDLITKKDVTIPAGERLLIDTGVRVILPQGYEGQIRPKSGLSSKGMDVKFGTVDEGYHGTLMVNMKNDNDEDYEFRIGEKVAQFVPVRRDDYRTKAVTVFQYDDLAREAERREGKQRTNKGFGSSGA